MTETPNLGKMVPGFEFLQNLVRSAGAAVPGMGQWVAPTLDPVEIEKRIDELRTVQFWLEHNARMLATTIQALEVQRMTLSTLQTMNVQMTDLRDAMKIAPLTASGEAASRPAKKAPVAPASGTDPAGSAEPLASAASAQAQPSAPAVDPLQWWTALTRQFTEIAGNAMKDSATDATRQAMNVASQAASATLSGKGSSKPDAAAGTAAPASARSGNARTRAGAAPRSRGAGSKE